MKAIDITEELEDGLKAFMMTLRPRRSADPRVAYGFCGILGFIWLCAGLFITWMGGWPVFGFFGIEFIFIATLVHMFIRKTEVIESILITQESVVVTRKELGLETSKSFPAYWTNVHFNGSAERNRPLHIRSHGESIEIGKFLSASEKSRTELTLNGVLSGLRTYTPDEQNQTEQTSA